jgi:DNA-directed RNA polymerase subunit H (RpoH/RPB5)
MYRFLIKEDEWLVRFSAHASFGEEEKEAVLRSIKYVEKDLPLLTHGDAFTVLDKTFGFIVIKVERVPSLIMTVCSIIPKERCYFR